MLKSKIIVDLPSAETQRRKGPIEWVRGVFGAKLDLRSGKEELTVSAMSLVEGMHRAFSQVGINNAISFLVDKKVVYIDNNDVDNDLPLVMQAAQEAGVLDKPFKEMHLVLAHKEAGLHTIIDIEIENEVILGGEEMTIVLSSRFEEMRIKPGETAEQYATRIKAFATDGSGLEPYKHALDALTESIAQSLQSTLVGSRVRTEPAGVQIIRPDAKQIARFRELGFGDNVSQPTYRPVPTRQRYGAYADPFYYYYYDPYYDFMSWVLIDSMFHSAWHPAYVSVIDPYGGFLYTGDNAYNYINDGWVGSSVSYTGGDIYVPPSIPEASGDMLSGSGGSEWSGGGDLSSGGGGGDDNSWSSFANASDDSSSSSSSCSSSSSDSSSSSCSSSSSSCSSGSSCSSSSSCGSSCSSGSSCGSSCSS